MESLVIAYLLAWAATSAYIGWLVAQNARLLSRQNELQKRLTENENADILHSTAA